MCRISTNYTALATVVAIVDLRFITQNKKGIHMKENFEENTNLMCPTIIATSHYAKNAVLLITISI